MKDMGFLDKFKKKDKKDDKKCGCDKKDAEKKE